MEAPELRRQRQEFEDKVKEIGNEEDPLAVYVQYVQWIINNYGQTHPSSGLLKVLAAVTKTFRHDSLYKTDLRYLKLWILYTRQLDNAEVLGIFDALLKEEIGISYSALYEEYAANLVDEGRILDANQIFLTGINRQARPLDRLKARYSDFKKRHASKLAEVTRNQKRSKRLSIGDSLSIHTRAQRYELMMAPPPPEKRREIFEFDLSLLYTEEHGEFCYEEARARHMGLLGKQWPPLPKEQPSRPVSVASSRSTSSSSSSSAHVEDVRTVKPSRKKSLLNGEPTMTINTKEALADVFGMFNSPTKTIKGRAGSKHAPLKSVDSIPTPAPRPQSEIVPKIPGAVFQPYVDENPPVRKENQPSQAKFTPFVDPDPPPRPVLAAKGSTTLPRNENQVAAKVLQPKPISEDGKHSFPFRVFTPAKSTLPPLAPLRDVFTDDHGKPLPKSKPLHERAKSHHDIPSIPPLSDQNSRTPFRVFSKPVLSENGVPKTPSIVFPPDAKPFHIYQDPQVEKKVEDISDEPATPEDDEDDVEEEEDLHDGPSIVDHSRHQELEDDDQYDNDYETPEDYEVLLPTEDDHRPDWQEIDRGPPLGGRFGQFNVMTPITERTYEFTSSTRTLGTPSERPRRRLLEGDERSEGEQMLGDGDSEQDEQQDGGIQPFVLPTDDLEEMTGKLSLRDALTLSANFRPPNPCNPFSPDVLPFILSRLPSDPHYHDLRTQDSCLLDELERSSKKGRKTSAGSTSGDFSSLHRLNLAGHKYQVSKKLGEGGFGSVFQAQNLGISGGEVDTDDEDFDLLDEDEIAHVAVKITRPRTLWEYHVLRRLHTSLPVSVRQSVILPHALYAFRDESFLIMDLCTQGPLLDIVNKASSAGVSQQGACLDELLVMFFAVELLRVLEVMHSIGFIHGDLKIDNCLLRLEDVPGGQANWSSDYSPSGDNGWAFKGLKLIDFGRTIDTRLFPQDQQFIADWVTDERDCFEIRQGKAWTYQTDYFGLAGIVYCMLFGKYLESSSISGAQDGQYKIATPLKRYWKVELWNSLFDLLLNPCSVRQDGQLPLTDELRTIREEMELWLQANCNRTSGTLKGLLKKVELACLRR